jgi:hypothetical protein
MANFEKDKLNVNELIKKASQSDNMNTSEGIKSFLDNNLDEFQANAIKNLLNDEEKTKALLNSDAAKALFKKLMGEKPNG